MFTACGQTEEKLEGFDAGADAYLTKPTQPRELIAQVKAVLKRAGRGQVVEPQKEYTLQGRLIGVLAAKGGVGVSTLALNLGIAMRGLSRKSVLVSDFRPGSGSIGLELGYEVNQGLSRLLRMNL
jgi:Flp pilus assembly CpaE family ATPase